MNADSVVEDFDVFKYDLLRLGASLEMTAVDQLVLERVPETFSGSVVVAAAAFAGGVISEAGLSTQKT